MTTISSTRPCGGAWRIALVATPAQAFFHLWTLAEFYTSADGSVQFIEIVTSGSFETASSGAQIRTTSESHTFNFPSSLADPDLRQVVARNSGFGTLAGGVTPDYVLPCQSSSIRRAIRLRIFHPFAREFQTKTVGRLPDRRRHVNQLSSDRRLAPDQFADEFSRDKADRSTCRRQPRPPAITTTTSPSTPPTTPSGGTRLVRRCEPRQRRRRRRRRHDRRRGLRLLGVDTLAT